MTDYQVTSKILKVETPVVIQVAETPTVQPDPSVLANFGQNKFSEPEYMYYKEQARAGMKMRENHQRLNVRLNTYRNGSTTTGTKSTSRSSKASVLLQQHSGVGMHQVGSSLKYFIKKIFYSPCAKNEQSQNGYLFKNRAAFFYGKI